jgi:choline dehydrogenase-like flavoprotein
MPEIRYDITAADHRRMLRGIELLGELHFTMGAEEVLLPLEDAPRARSVDELRSITRNHSDMAALELFTVHLMGTARMGTSPRDSVVDAQGQLWDLPGCYVADASLLPTALGVNPQLTIMALATHVARSLTLPQAA